MKQIIKLFQILKKIFLGYKTPPCVGVDIGSASIKMVELCKDSLKISSYSIKAVAKNLVVYGVINNIEQVSEIILSQWQLLNSEYTQIAIAIPYNAVIIKDMLTPKFKTKYELDNYVLKQLIQELDTDDIDFDYEITLEHLNEQNILVIVAKKEKIEEYQAVVQIADISISAIDVEPFAIQHLFDKLLKRQQFSKQMILVDIGLTRIRAYAFEQQQHVYFNEINVDYYPYIEDVILNSAKDIALKGVVDVNNFLVDLINQNKVRPNELADIIVADVNKLLQLVKSNLLVEKKISLSMDYDIYLMGGNSLIPGVLRKISNLQHVKVYYADEFISTLNKNIARSDLIRLIPAISLATWGQQIG